MIRLLASALLFSTLLAPAMAGQAPEPPEIVGIRVGFAGNYKAGLWTPVEVTLRAGDKIQEGQVAIVVPDGDGVPSRYTVPVQGTCRLVPGQETRVLAYVRLGRVHGQLSVEFQSGQQVLTQRVFNASISTDPSQYPPALLSERPLILVVGGSEEDDALIDQRADEEAAVVRLDSTTQLPDRWIGYEGVDAIVLLTSNPDIYQSLAPDGPQLAALEQWIRMGGRVLLSVGEQGEAVLKPGMPLVRLAPGRLEKMVPLRQAATLETYAGSSIAITAADGRKLELHVPMLADVAGTIEAREARLPLIVRRALGFGQVVFIAADLERSPLADWPDRVLLVRKLLDMPTAQADETYDGRAVMHFGYTDMAGHLRSALDHFRGMRLAPFSLVATIIVVYILAIGLGDYFFLRKVLRRMELTWVTFPAIVLAVCVGVYFLAGWLKGDRVLVNQIDLIDVDAESGRLRGTAWANLFSPKMDRYNLAFQTQSFAGTPLERDEVYVSWLGLPDESLGGMNPKTVEPMGWRGAYDFSPDLGAIRGMPVQIWSTKSLTARWTAPADVVPKAEIRSEDRQPVGEITNSLDFALTDCVLAYGIWAYELGTIQPGETVRLDSMLKRRELHSLLTGRRIVFEKDDKTHEEITPYDQSSVDPVYILRTMVFFEMAGGRRYTGLDNRYQPFVDLSSLLKTDRAILMATADADKAQTAHRGAVLLRDGKPLHDPRNRHKAVYRFVFPVRPEQGG